MNPKLKSVLIITAKNAVNAILTNSALLTLLGNWQQLGTRAGWVLVLKTTLSVVFAREAIAWGPKIIAWSNSTEPIAHVVPEVK